MFLVKKTNVIALLWFSLTVILVYISLYALASGLAGGSGGVFYCTTDKGGFHIFHEELACRKPAIAGLISYVSIVIAIYPLFKTIQTLVSSKK